MTEQKLLGLPEDGLSSPVPADLGTLKLELDRLGILVLYDRTTQTFGVGRGITQVFRLVIRFLVLMIVPKSKNTSKGTL